MQSALLGLCWPERDVALDEMLVVSIDSGQGVMAHSDQKCLERLSVLRRMLGALQDQKTPSERVVSAAVAYHRGWTRWAEQNRVLLAACDSVGFVWNGSPALQNTRLGNECAAVAQTAHTLLFETAMSGWCAFYAVFARAYAVAPLTNFLRPEARDFLTEIEQYTRAASMYTLAYRLLRNVLQKAVRPMRACRKLASHPQLALPEMQEFVVRAFMCVTLGCLGRVLHNRTELEHHDVLNNVQIGEDLEDVRAYMSTQQTAYQTLAWTAHVFGCGVQWLKMTSRTHGEAYAVFLSLRRMALARALMRAAAFLSRYSVWSDELVQKGQTVLQRNKKVSTMALRYGTKAAQLALVVSALVTDCSSVVRPPAHHKFMEEVLGEHTSCIVPNYVTLLGSNQVVGFQMFMDDMLQNCVDEMRWPVTMQMFVQYYFQIVGLCPSDTPLSSWLPKGG